MTLGVEAANRGVWSASSGNKDSMSLSLRSAIDPLRKRARRISGDRLRDGTCSLTKVPRDNQGIIGWHRRVSRLGPYDSRRRLSSNL